MTVIAAYVDVDGIVAIGSDSRAESGYIRKDNPQVGYFLFERRDVGLPSPGCQADLKVFPVDE